MLWERGNLGWHLSFTIYQLCDLGQVSFLSW